MVKSMKYLLSIISLIAILSCSRRYGYIYDENRKPLRNVLAQDIQNPSNKIITQDNGEFSFSDCGDLIISKQGYKTDTLEKFGCKPAGKCFDGHIFYMKKIIIERIP